MNDETFDNKDDQDYIEAKEALRQKSRTNGYGSLTKEEKTQLYLYGLDDESELDIDEQEHTLVKYDNNSYFEKDLPYEYTNQQSKHSLICAFIFIGVFGVLFLITATIFLVSTLISYYKDYEIGVIVLLYFIGVSLVVGMIFSYKYIRATRLKQLSDYKHIDKIKLTIEKLSYYQLYKKTNLLEFAFVGLFAVVAGLIPTFIIISGSDDYSDALIIVLYTISFLIMIGLIFWIICVKTHPKYFAMLEIGDNKLYSYFLSKSDHVFSDGSVFVSTQKNKIYRMGISGYKNIVRNLVVDSFLNEPTTKFAETKNNFVIIDRKQHGLLKSELLFDKDYNIKTLSIHSGSRGRHGSHTSVEFIASPHLLNNKFYLPKALKSKLEKENVEYLNDSRIVFVDDIYEVLKQAKRQKKYGGAV